MASIAAIANGNTAMSRFTTILLLLMRGGRMSGLRLMFSARQPAAALGIEAHRSLRAVRYFQIDTGRNQDVLPHVHDVVAVAAEIRLSANDARKDIIGVRARGGSRHELEIVGLHANARRLSGPGKFALSDFQRVTTDLDRVSGHVRRLQDIAAADETRHESRV